MYWPPARDRPAAAELEEGQHLGQRAAALVEHDAGADADDAHAELAPPPPPRAPTRRRPAARKSSPRARPRRGPRRRDGRTSRSPRRRRARRGAARRPRRPATRLRVPELARGQQPPLGLVVPALGDVLAGEVDHAVAAGERRGGAGSPRAARRRPRRRAPRAPCPGRARARSPRRRGAQLAHQPRADPARGSRHRHPHRPSLEVIGDIRRRARRSPATRSALDRAELARVAARVAERLVARPAPSRSARLAGDRLGHRGRDVAVERRRDHVVLAQCRRRRSPRSPPPRPSSSPR